MRFNYYLLWCGVCSVLIEYFMPYRRCNVHHKKIGFRKESQTQLMRFVGPGISFQPAVSPFHYYLQLEVSFMTFVFFFRICSFPCWTPNMNKDSCICNRLSISIKSIHNTHHIYLCIKSLSLLSIWRESIGKR